eukprot:gene38282-43362_t
MRWSNRNVTYQGVWVQGKLEGRSKKINEDGTTLEGEFRNGNIFNGTGVLVHSDGAVYEGTWVEGKFDGPGKKTSAQGH